MPGPLPRLRSFLRGLREPHRLERDMDDEMRFHVDMAAERLVRERGLTPREARRRARAAFGRPERWKEQGRAARGLARITSLSLDAKLGARMLAKHPGVSIVGGLAMAIGVGLGAGWLEVVNDIVRPDLPLAEAERVVGLQLWDPVENDPELRSLHDFAVWKEELETVRHIGAYRSIERNVGLAAGGAEPAHGAEISAAAFPLTRVPPLIGRTLVEADEGEGASPVIVLGHDLWRSRFLGDPAVVGRTILVGSAGATVVGVMPEGFGFPVSHQFWVPLRLDPLAYGPRQGPGIRVFGRLAPGATLEEAQAEVAAIGAGRAVDLPATHERLRARVVPYLGLYQGAVVGGDGSGMHMMQIVFVALLLVLASNVATMVFARTATRESEIAMRFALGASRRQILAQFFVEALVLALAATAVGLGVVAWAAKILTRWAWELTEGQVPFWLEEGLGLNPTTVLYALALALVAAGVAGVMPALKVTAAKLQARLRHAAGAGDSSLRFGGIWSAMIVVQVAFAVLVLPPAVVAARELMGPGYVEPGFPAEEYLSAAIGLDLEEPPADSAEAAAFFAEFEAAREELRRRLLAEPEVSRVTFATRIPVMDHPQLWMQADRGEGVPIDAEGHWVMVAAVEEGFFETFGAEIAQGRKFSAADEVSDARVVIVNEDFVDEMLGGRNAIGRAVRYMSVYGERAATGRAYPLPRERMREPSEWFEIVGVVRGLGMDTNRDPFFSGRGPGVYHPLTKEAMGSAGSYGVRVAVHVRGEAASFAPRLREIAHAVSPALRLRDVLPLDGPVDRVNRNERIISRSFSWATALTALVAVLISAAGVYSLLSFTVARQTREIGIRVALGADRRRIVREVFSRVMTRFGIGIAVGYAFWILVLGKQMEDGAGLIFLATTMVLVVVGAVGCGVPVRRALRIEPTEALREG